MEMRRVVPTRSRAGTLAVGVLATLGVLTGLCGFVPSIALANDLSTDSCTAQDVTIIGNGIILNEPCTCPPGSTFAAMVQFTVQNNASASRFCIALHFAADPSGTVATPPDIILNTMPDLTGTSTIPGKSTISMYGTIASYPCSAGLVCFGQAGVVSGKCLPNTCSTIAWNTAQGDANCTTADQSPSPGQCRHQQICIQGYGASLSCKSGCTPTCGGTAVLTASVSGGTPGYTYTVTGDDGTSQTYPATGTTTATSHDFTVTVTQNTTYTLTVTDSLGCQRMATKSLNASPIAQPTLAAGTPACDGTTTFTASPSGLADYVFTIDGTTTDNKTSNVLTTKLTLGATHLVSVTVANSYGCTSTSSTIKVPVNAQVAVSASAGNPDCKGNVTLTATASGGADGFTYQWFDGTTSLGTTNPLTVTLPQDGKDHSITVKATDSAGCSNTSAPAIVHINQPILVSGSAGNPDCKGNVALTATASGGADGFTYQWFDSTTSIATGQSPTVTLAPGDHSITVKATDSNGCSNTSAPTTVHINQPVATTLDTGSTSGCGTLTFTASATGGTGTYTYAWTIDSNPVSGVSGPTLSYPPSVDCNPHTVAVTATDSNGCVSGNSVTRNVTQAVSTTVK